MAPLILGRSPLAAYKYVDMGIGEVMSTSLEHKVPLCLTLYSGLQEGLKTPWM